MDKEDIINYVMETPGNSNPAVLGSMLEQYGSSGGSVLLVNATDDPDSYTYTLDKTAKEVMDAYLAGQTVIVSYDVVAQPSLYGSVVGCGEAGDGFNIYAMYGESAGVFRASTENDYPSYYYD